MKRTALVIVACSLLTITFTSPASAGPGTLRPGYLKCWAGEGRFNVKATAPVYANDSSMRETRYYEPFLWTRQDQTQSWRQVGKSSTSHWSNGDTAYSGETYRDETAWTETSTGRTEYGLPLHHTWATSEPGEYLLQQIVTDRRRNTQTTLQAETEGNPDIQSCAF